MSSINLSIYMNVHVCTGMLSPVPSSIYVCASRPCLPALVVISINTGAEWFRAVGPMSNVDVYFS
jgi:hypothetical protein